MTTRFDTKDPEEIVTAGFDFGSFADEVSAPTVDIAVRVGEDADPDAVKLGDPFVSGSWVYQRLQGGVHGVDYSIRCLADAGVDRPLIDAVLPVRSRPAA